VSNGKPTSGTIAATVEKAAMASVMVPVPRPATLTVAVPTFATPGEAATTFEVSAVSLKVTSAFVNDDPPSVPDASELT
jgi:hypothetical protein